MLTRQERISFAPPAPMTLFLTCRARLHAARRGGRRIIAGGALLCAGVLTAAAAAPADTLLKIDNGVVAVGIDCAKGGAITWLSAAAHPANMVNVSDPGRLIQQSYYAGRSLDRTAEGQAKAWSPWSWNPVQGGGVGSWARTTECRRIDHRMLFGETVPRLWDMPAEEAAARMLQWTGFEPGMPDVVTVRCEFISLRTDSDRWGAARRHAQELPAAYFTRAFSSARTYLGRGVWREEHAPVGPPWGKTEPPLHAMAVFAPDGIGVGIYSPAASGPWAFGPHGTGTSDDPSAEACTHISPHASLALGPTAVYEYRYWLVVGTAAEIATRFDTLIKRHAGERGQLAP